MATLAESELEEDELAEFVETVAKIAKVGIRAVKARINKERKERETARRKAMIASSADKRTVRPRPEPDGELLPTVRFLDAKLASDQGVEPPMRDASGNLVEVRVREPWALHLLTADGTNAAVEGGETMKAPPEPGMVQLTPIGIELLVEKYVRWSVQKKNGSYYGALPRPYIEGLREYPKSSIPVVRVINTAPLVTMSGRIICGVGLDRNTGLFHRIDPLLHACVPADPPSEKNVQDALNFLFDEWLVDVALDRVGKSIAIMLALTLLERALLPERPAFFVTAGQRGGGKTTLVHMVMSAVLGRRAAAASWSKEPEERKKALFSYFLQGVAALIWDNIPRGSAITCPHIEAALTSSEISDRVLGFSRVEVAPSTTVQIFTGNSILPRGDMASRSLIAALNVNRPDPENRDFAHPDPLAWTQANRPKLLGALYTILIAGALNRPQHQVAKTRFKIWWSLVGWPVEYAASLVGVTVNCTELLRAGELGDEEGSNVSATLKIFRQIWNKERFTTKDVSKVLTPEPGLEGLDTQVNGGRRVAVDLAEALAELAGKRLDSPTARSLGKLFQKRLVGRSAWIDDGGLVATLKKSEGHEENSYWVEVALAQARECGFRRMFAWPMPQRSFPSFPTFPRRNAGQGETAGMSGKTGMFTATRPPKR
jgi:hypothetical protein